MIQIINWLKKHPIATMAIICITFFLPLVVVHCLFKWNTECVWLSATWSSGDVLGYIAGFEAFLGTVVLGAITVYQTEIANKTSVRLSKENNYLQKISIQKMLPLLRVTALSVDNAQNSSSTYSATKDSTLEVVDVGTPQNRNTLIRTYLPRVGSANGYCKTIKLSLENISDGTISQISVDRIDFSGFKYKGNHTDMVSCVGTEKAKYISWLILPGDSLDVTVNIFYDNELYKQFWEYDEVIEFGCFDMCLYVTNKSLSGISYKEKIYVEKCVGFKERIMYKAYEGESEDA